MQTGTVKWFKQDKGYGFISPDNHTADVWVHASELTEPDDQYMTGVRVSYQVQTGPKGPKATNVRIIADLTQAYIQGPLVPPDVEDIRQRIYRLAEKHVRALADELTDLLVRE